MFLILRKPSEIWRSLPKYVGKKSLPEVWPPTVKTDSAFSSSSPASADQHPEERIHILLENSRTMKVCMLLDSAFGNVYVCCFNCQRLHKTRLCCGSICFKEKGKGRLFKSTAGAFLLVAWNALQQLERGGGSKYLQASDNIRNVIIVCFCPADPAKNRIWCGHMPFPFLVTYVYYTASIKR